MFALREMVNAPLPPPEEGRAENLLFPFLPLASRSVVPKTSTKEQFPLSLGPQRGRGVVNESNLSYTHPPLSPVGSCGRFERAVNRTTHAPSAGTQVSASHTLTSLRTGNETPEPGPCVPPRCPTAGTSVGSLVSIKRVGDLHAFSVDDSCLQFGPADSQIILRPRPGYVPKVPTTPFRDQVVSLQALPPEEADPALALLCPVRALGHYVDRTQSFRTSDQLFVCHGDRHKGKAVSKQRMAHWIVDAITLAYQAQGVPCPFRLRAHSTRSVASSWALARGASLTDICRAAGWATPNTFARFYSLRVEPVSSCVLTSNG